MISVTEMLDDLLERHPAINLITLSPEHEEEIGDEYNGIEVRYLKNMPVMSVHVRTL